MPTITPEKILEQAETELTTSPSEPQIPRGIVFPETVPLLLTEFDEERTRWLAADAVLAETVEQYRAALADDDRAMTEAATAGKTAPPKEKAPDMLRNVEFATRTSKARRTDVENVRRRIEQAVFSDPHFKSKIINNIRGAHGEWIAENDQIRANWSLANSKYAAHLNNLRFLQPLVRDRINFDISHAFHAEPTVAWPEPWKIQKPGLMQLLDRLDEI